MQRTDSGWLAELEAEGEEESEESPSRCWKLEGLEGKERRCVAAGLDVVAERVEACSE